MNSQHSEPRRVTSVEACRRVSRLVLSEVGNLLYGRTATLVVGERTCWRVAVWLSLPTEERGVGRYDALWLNAQGKPLTTDGIRQIVDRLAADASVTGRHNLYAFRHRVAQAWLDNGINAEIVSKALGHADVTTTLMIYGNQDDRRVSQAVREAEMAPFYDPSGADDFELRDIAHALVTSKT